MKTVIYARKSSESEDRQIQSIDDQLSALRDLAKRDGITIDEEFVEARSAKEPYTRPEFQRLCEAIRSGRVCCVLTWSMNRLSRNLVDGGLIAHMLQTGQLDWIRTIDRTYLPEDNVLLLSIENGMATGFIQDLRKNVVRGMDGKAARGWYPGRTPIGYLNNPITREIEPDLERFPLLRKAWDLMLTSGYSASDVYRELCRLGLTSHARKRTRRPLSKHVVFRMFSNPFYTGKFSYKGEVLPGKHRALVTQAEYAAVQRILGRDVVQRNRKHSFAFAGLFECGNCGCHIVADRKVKSYQATSRQVTYTYYHCTNGRGGCSKRAVTEAALAEKVRKVFSSIRIPAPFAAWALEEAVRQAEQESVVTASSVSAIQKQIAVQKDRLDKLNEMRLDGEVTGEEYADLKKKIAVKVAKLEKAATEVQSEQVAILELIEEKLKLAVEAAEYESKHEARKRGMLLALGGRHYLTLGKVQFAVHPILRKIVTFEPLANGSQSPKPGDLLPASSVWCALIQDIRTVAREELRCRHRDSNSEVSFPGSWSS